MWNWDTDAKVENCCLKLYLLVKTNLCQGGPNTFFFSVDNEKSFWAEKYKDSLLSFNGLGTKCVAKWVSSCSWIGSGGDKLSIVHFQKCGSVWCGPVFCRVLKVYHHDTSNTQMNCCYFWNGTNHKCYILSPLIDSLWHFTWCRYPPNSSANDLLNPPCSCSVGTQICPDNSFYPPVKQRMVRTLLLYRILGDNN